MIFRLTGESGKIKKELDIFIKLAKEEYSAKVGKIRNVPTPFGVSVNVKDISFEMGYYDDGSDVIFWNNFSLPKIWGVGFFRKKVVKKMIKNLEGFFKAKGLEVKIKYVKE